MQFVNDLIFNVQYHECEPCCWGILIGFITLCYAFGTTIDICLSAILWTLNLGWYLTSSAFSSFCENFHFGV